MASTSPQFCWKAKFSPKRTKCKPFEEIIWHCICHCHGQKIIQPIEQHVQSLQVGQRKPEAQISRYSRGQTALWCGHWGQQKLWTHGFEDTTWQRGIFYFSSTEAMGIPTLQHSPTFPSPIKSQIKDLAVVIYPIPLCNAIRCLETPQVLNSNYCVFLCFCLTDQKAFCTFSVM